MTIDVWRSYTTLSNLGTHPHWECLYPCHLKSDLCPLCTRLPSICFNRNHTKKDRYILVHYFISYFLCYNIFRGNSFSLFDNFLFEWDLNSRDGFISILQLESLHLLNRVLWSVHALFTTMHKLKPQLGYTRKLKLQNLFCTLHEVLPFHQWEF